MEYSRVNEVSEVVVGETYLVPCCLNISINYYGCQFLPVLVVEETHHDQELGEKLEHLHFDSRFIPDDELLIYKGHCFSAVSVHTVGTKATWEELEEMAEIIWMHRKCYRINQCFPSTKGFINLTKRVSSLVVGQPLKNMVCPHKGMNMNGHSPQIINGQKVFVCPGHGLKWDLDTGQLLS